jgi:hypothetical protein
MAAAFNVKEPLPVVSRVISTVAKSVLQNINGQNYEGAIVWFQIFDAFTPPSIGDVPLFNWEIPIDGGFNFDAPGPSPQAPTGQEFTLGISCGWSLSPASYDPATVGGTLWATGRN